MSSHVRGFLLSWTSLFKPASLSPTDHCSSLTPALLSSIASTFWLTLGLASSAVFSPWNVNCVRLHGLFCPLPCAQGLKERPPAEGLMLATDLLFPPPPRGKVGALLQRHFFKRTQTHLGFF